MSGYPTKEMRDPLGEEEVEDEIPVLFNHSQQQLDSFPSSDPLGEPLPEAEEDPDQDITVIPSTFFSSSSSIHPSFKVPRIKNITEFTMEKVDTAIRTFITNCLSSRKDPRCRHQFYLTVHTHLNEALHHRLISPGEVDSLWRKYDEWAASTTSYRLGDHYMLQYRNRANDPDEEPVAPRTSGRYKKHLMIRNLEWSVREHVLNRRSLPIRDDLHARVKFYEKWHKYWTPGTELFLDHFWNALLNRTPNYYEGTSSSTLRSPPVSHRVSALPPSPHKMRVPPPPPSPTPSKVTSPLKRGAPSPKNLDMDRLVKLCINSLVDEDHDPRTCHRFYWTIYRALDTVSSLNMSSQQVDALYVKYDSWARKAFRDKKKFQVPDAPLLYSSVDELPPLTKKPTVPKPAQIKHPYPQNLHSYMKILLGSFMQGNQGIYRDDIVKRRQFFEKYAPWVEPHWDEGLLDYYWNLVVAPDHPPGGKKLDMDRLVKLCINYFIAQKKDPRAHHRFYWTIYRALEMVSSLRLSKEDVDSLWRKYNCWAKEAWVNKRLLAVGGMSRPHEFYEVVRELPQLNRHNKTKELSKKNGLRKILEKTVREVVIARGDNKGPCLLDLAARRRFFDAYCESVTDEDLDNEWLIDGYWKRLLEETVKDYKLYLELGKIVGEKMDKEGEKNDDTDGTGSSSKKFNLDLLVKKVINECIEQGKDPRLCHRYYRTMHRCLEEANENGKMTVTHLDGVWRQYDSMAQGAWETKTPYTLTTLNPNEYYSTVEELPPREITVLEGPSVTQLFPNCPRSMALKRFLEERVQHIVKSSELVTSSRNRILHDWRTRRRFFLEYRLHLDGFPDVERLVEGYWKKLVTEKKKRYSQLLQEGTCAKKKAANVPCVVLDDED